MPDNVVACIGWGSLVWRPEDLPMRGPWYCDGPLLPIEFARESQDKTITLVICPTSPRVRTYWTILDTPSAEEGRRSLGLREYRRADAKWVAENIGVVDRVHGSASGAESGPISEWGASLGLSAVVWTNLPPKFAGVKGAVPTSDQVISHLKELEGELREKAERYVRHAPGQIDTPYRRRIEAELGWLRVEPDEG